MFELWGVCDLGGGAWTSSVPFDPSRPCPAASKAMKWSAGVFRVFDKASLSCSSSSPLLPLHHLNVIHIWLECLIHILQTFGIYSLFYRPTFSSINTSSRLLSYSFISFFSFMFLLSYFCLTVDIYERRDTKFLEVCVFLSSSCSSLGCSAAPSPVLPGASSCLRGSCKETAAVLSVGSSSRLTLNTED